MTQGKPHVVVVSIRHLQIGYDENHGFVNVLAVGDRKDVTIEFKRNSDQWKFVDFHYFPKVGLATTPSDRRHPCYDADVAGIPVLEPRVFDDRIVVTDHVVTDGVYKYTIIIEDNDGFRYESDPEIKNRRQM